MGFRVPAVKAALVAAAKHDERYGRGSAAVAEATRLARHGVEIDYWASSIKSAATRAALIRFKLGMIPGIKATIYKWKGQLARYSLGDVAKLMACPCGVDGPQDPFHLAFECARTKPFWDEALAAMDGLVLGVVAPMDVAVAIAVAWAGLSPSQKIKWGLTASDAGFPAALAASLHQCAAAAVVKIMASGARLFGDSPALRDLALPFVCVSAPTVLQGMPVLLTRAPSLADRARVVPRLLAWPLGACPVAVAPLGTGGSGLALLVFGNWGSGPGGSGLAPLFCGSTCALMV